LFFVCGGPLRWATMARWGSAIPQSGRGGFAIGLQPGALPACASITALAGNAGLSRLPGKAIPEIRIRK